MIDTLQINCLDWEVNSENKLILQPAKIEVSSMQSIDECLLFKASNRELIFGEKAFYNSNIINLTIKPMKQIREVMLFVNVSLPKVYYKGNNYHPVDKEQMQETLDIVQKELENAGIKTNIYNAKVSRMDLFKNVYPEHHFLDYRPVFRILKMKYEKEKYRKEYGTTFTYGNKSNMMCVYDKIWEMKLKGMDTTNYPKTIRFELRMHKSKNIREKLKIKNLDDLIRVYPELNNYYKEVMIKNLFKYEPEQVQIQTIQDIEQELYFYRERYKHYLGKYLQVKGIEAVLEVMQYEQLLQILKNVCYDEKTAYREIKKMKQLMLDYEMIKRNGETTVASLYNELKQKLIA